MFEVAAPPIASSAVVTSLSIIIPVKNSVAFSAFKV